MGNDARIRTQGDLHARPVGFGDVFRVFFLIHEQALPHGFRRPVHPVGDHVLHRQRRHQIGSGLLEKTDRFLIQKRTVFNGVHPRPQGRVDPGGGVGVGGDPQLKTAGRLHGGPQFVLRERRGVPLAAGAFVAAASRVNFNQIGTLSKLPAHRPPAGVRAVAQSVRLETIQNAIRPVQQVPMTAGGRYGRPCRQDPGAWRLPRPNGVAQHDDRP